MPIRINKKTIYRKNPIISNLKLNLTLKDDNINFDTSGN